PAFLVIFTLTILLSAKFVPESPLSHQYFFAALFFLANWTILNNGEMMMLNHIWSLAIEEQFYFLWPQAAKRLKNATLFKLALAVAVFCELLRIALTLLHVNLYIVYKITPTRVD